MATTIKNAAILLFTGKNLDRVVMVRDANNKQWMIPGGKIDYLKKQNRWETPFEAAVREFREETGFRRGNKNKQLDAFLYNRTNFIKFERKYRNTGEPHTAIYIGQTKMKFPTYNRNTVKDHETDNLLYVCVSSFNNNYTKFTTSKIRGDQLVENNNRWSFVSIAEDRGTPGEKFREHLEKALMNCGTRGGGNGGRVGTRGDPVIISSNPNNIGFDIDGVLHRNVRFEGKGGNAQGHPRGNIKENLRNYPYSEIIERIKRANQEGKKIFLITHNGTVRHRYLQTIGLGFIPVDNIIIAGKDGTARDKAVYIAVNNISEFYDDSSAVLARIYHQLISSTQSMPDGKYYKMRPLKLWQTCPIVDKLNNPPCNTRNAIEAFPPDGGSGGGGGSGKSKLWNCGECQSLGLTPYGVTTGVPAREEEKVEVFNCRGCTKSEGETKGGRRRKTKRRRKKRRKKTRKKKRHKRRRTKRI
jgi:hypothetical protein